MPEVNDRISVDQISKIIKNKDVSYAFHCFIPSQGKEVPFAEINTSQQKRLVKSVLDSPIYNTEFIYTFRDILKENCQESDINIDNLTIIDKLFLALNLRIKSIGNEIEIEIKTKTKDVNAKLNLDDILQSALTRVVTHPPIDIEDAYFKITCALPTIGTEYRLEKEMRGNKKADIEIEDVEELRRTVGDVFISEIVKYVSEVWVKSQEDNSLIPVNIQTLSFRDRIKIVEMFKANMLKGIMDYMNKIRTEINKIELYKFDLEGETYEQRLSIDGNFFTIS